MNSHVVVATFLRDGGKFVPFNEVTAPISRPEYVEGAISLQVGKTELLGVELWDLVDQLWGLLVVGLKTVAKGQSYECYFPDQPVKLMMHPDPRRDVIEIGVKAHLTKNVSVSSGKLMAALLAEGSAFFSLLREINPSHGAVYTTHLDEINDLRTRLKLSP